MWIMMIRSNHVVSAIKHRLSFVDARVCSTHCINILIFPLGLVQMDY